MKQWHKIAMTFVGVACIAAAVGLTGAILNVAHDYNLPIMKVVKITLGMEPRADSRRVVARHDHGNGLIECYSDGL